MLFGNYDVELKQYDHQWINYLATGVQFRVIKAPTVTANFSESSLQPQQILEGSH